MTTIRVLSASDVRNVLPPRAAVDAMRSAFRQISSGEAVVPVRLGVDSPDGVTLLMPASLHGSRELGAKIVSVFPGNADRGEPPVQGAVLLLDAGSGRPRALLDGTVLTGVRTAAGSALATEVLADPDADVLAVIGAGAQAEAHARMFAALRPLREIRILSRSGSSAERLAERLRAERESTSPPGSGAPPEVRAVETPAEALLDASLVVTATTSPVPVFDDRELEEGAHVNAVGAYRPDMQEVPAETVARARVVVDQREAVREESGDLIIPRETGIFELDPISAELGDILLGRAPRGRVGHEVTLFESVGNAAQDVAIAEAALAEAERTGAGTVVPF